MLKSILQIKFILIIVNIFDIIENFFKFKKPFN